MIASLRNFIFACLLIVLNPAVIADSVSLECLDECQSAFNELKKYARNGSPHAQTLLALTYKTGEMEIAKDKDQAWKWIKRAKNQSFPPAMYHLSRWYRQGFRTDVNIAEADRYLERAATFGYAPALYEYGVRMLNKGDYDDGIRYINAAAEKNNRSAISLIERLQSLSNTAGKKVVLDDSAMAEALVNQPGDNILVVQGSRIQPESLFVTVLEAIRAQAVYSTKGTTGSHLSDVKCGQPGSGCRVIDFDESAISSDFWLSNGMAGR
jgi:tetratricopeptide (TPR) repeat protein